MRSFVRTGRRLCSSTERRTPQSPSSQPRRCERLRASPARARGLTRAPRAQASDPRRWQRWHERAAVSEWCHFKLVTLLLHTGIPSDAVAQLQRHVARHRRPPAGLPAVLLPAHWGYLLRQFSVFGELLQARLPAGQQASALPHAEQPGTYFAAAADAGIRRRQAWAVLMEMHDALPSPPQAAAGMYVGQFRREPSGPSLSDDEFAAHMGAAEAPNEYFKTNLELLSRAHTLLKHANADAAGCRRALSAVLSQMANEYLCAGDSASALRLLRSVAAVYRQEGWDALLAGTLASLRECAGRLSLHDEHAEWSLELGSLQADAGASASERAAVLSAALAALCVRDDGCALTIPAEVRPAARLSMRDSDAASATQACVTCVGGFSPTPASAGNPLRFYVALQSRTTGPLRVRSAALELQSEDGAVSTVELLQPDGGSLDALRSRAWTVLAALVPTPASGATRATAVLLHVSAFSTLRCPLAEAGPPADASPLACADPLAVGAARILRLGAAVGQLAVTSTVGAPSGTLSMSLPARALVAELVRVDVTLAALVRVARPRSTLAALTQSQCRRMLCSSPNALLPLAPLLMASSLSRRSSLRCSFRTGQHCRLCTGHCSFPRWNLTQRWCARSGSAGHTPARHTRFPFRWRARRQEGTRCWSHGQRCAQPHNIGGSAAGERQALPSPCDQTR